MSPSPDPQPAAVPKESKRRRGKRRPIIGTVTLANLSLANGASPPDPFTDDKGRKWRRPPEVAKDAFRFDKNDIYKLGVRGHPALGGKRLTLGYLHVCTPDGRTRDVLYAAEDELELIAKYRKSPPAFTNIPMEERGCMTLRELAELLDVSVARARAIATQRGICKLMLIVSPDGNRRRVQTVDKHQADEVKREREQPLVVKSRVPRTASRSNTYTPIQLDENGAEYYAPKLAAEYCNVGAVTLRRWVHNGCPWLIERALITRQLPYRHWRSVTFFKKSQLDRIRENRSRGW